MSFTPAQQDRLVAERCRILAAEVARQAHLLGMSLRYMRSEVARPQHELAYQNLLFEGSPMTITFDELEALLQRLDGHPLSVEWSRSERESDLGHGFTVCLFASVSRWPEQHSALRGEWVLTADGRVLTLPDLVTEAVTTTDVEGDTWATQSFALTDSAFRKRAVALFEAAKRGASGA